MNIGAILKSNMSLAVQQDVDNNSHIVDFFTDHEADGFDHFDYRTFRQTLISVKRKKGVDNDELAGLMRVSQLKICEWLNASVFEQPTQRQIERLYKLRFGK